MRQTWDVLPRTTVNTVFIQTTLLVSYVVATSNTIVLESTVLISICTLPTLIGICALTFAVEFTRDNYKTVMCTLCRTGRGWTAEFGGASKSYGIHSSTMKLIDELFFKGGFLSICSFWGW